MPSNIFSTIRNHSLTIALSALFVACGIGAGYTGWLEQNRLLAAHYHAGVNLGAFLLSGSFIESLAVNWQAAILQIATLMIFSGFLYQRGAPHSRNPAKKRRSRKRPVGSADWVWRNSLSLALGMLFLTSFAVHAVSGAAAYNEERLLHGQTATGLSAYLHTPRFWSANFQTWQAEYLVIAVYLVLSIFLRQQDSAESKPPEEDNRSTGQHND
jgi:hypothetical protein